MWSMVAYAYHPSYIEGINRSIMVPDWPVQKARPNLKNNIKQKGLGPLF
jgi:hypothetical protein